MKMIDAKTAIQKAAEDLLGGGPFHVLCSSADIEYITRAEVFCVSEAANGICYAFQT